MVESRLCKLVAILWLKLKQESRALDMSGKRFFAFFLTIIFIIILFCFPLFKKSCRVCISWFTTGVETPELQGRGCLGSQMRAEGISLSRKEPVLAHFLVSGLQYRD